MIPILLKSGCQVNGRNKVCCEGERGRDVRRVDDACALAPPSQGGWTPLMVAVWHGHSAIVEVLLRAGADVNAINEAGICALTLAVVKHPTLIRLLATSTCQLNTQDKEVGRQTVGEWSYTQSQYSVGMQYPYKEYVGVAF